MYRSRINFVDGFASYIVMVESLRPIVPFINTVWI